MISEHVFYHEGADDFAKNFTASLEQDYITLCMYQKGHQYDPITVGKNAAKAVVKLAPYNFTEETHRTYLTADEKILFLSSNTLPPNAPP